jgi:hypothetical protein
MMSRRKRVLLGLGGATVFVAAAFAYLFWPEPGFYRASFDAIRLGMTVEEVGRIVPAGRPAEPDLPRYARSVAAHDWEGTVDGQVRRVHLAGQIMLKGNPALRGSLSQEAQFREEPGMGYPVAFGLWQDGKRVATGRAWEGPTDSLIVVFDNNGKVVERTYVTIRLEPHWFRQVREAVGPLWPF